MIDSLSPSVRILTNFCVPLAILFTGVARTVADEAPLAPVGILLTWQEDPCTTMTVDWHRRPTELDQPPQIDARVKGASKWTLHDAKRFDFPFSDRKIDRVELRGLLPETEYEFRGGEGSRVFSFKTMPRKLIKPLVFAAGGDVRHRQEWMEEMNRVAMSHQPEFILWGGDLAYGDGVEKNLHRWYEWFEANMNSLVTNEGRIPPIVVGVGNHEVQGGYHQGRMNDDRARRTFAPYFFNLFAFPGQPGYNALDFSDYLSLVIADTDHANPMAGVQTEWLARTLAARENMTHLIPVYHVPAYPSVRDFNDAVSRGVRESWVPLFEKYGVQLAFEHHDHAYKRTHPIRGGKLADDGIVFVGDGSWGVEPRPVHDSDTTWYLAKSRSIRHGMIVTLTPTSKKVVSYSHTGELLDEVEIPVR